MDAEKSGSIHSVASGSSWEPWPARTFTLLGMRTGAKEMILGGKNKIKSSTTLRKIGEIKKPFLLEQNQTTNMLEKRQIPRSTRTSGID